VVKKEKRLASKAGRATKQREPGGNRENPREKKTATQRRGRAGRAFRGETSAGGREERALPEKEGYEDACGFEKKKDVGKMCVKRLAPKRGSRQPKKKGSSCK